ncbi:probable 26S proteasome regulatory subunit p27 [Anopheles stephensi]|uniref:probable 26S proteasome regulatory subunit p27 n=1 Tax=Anopheles stephensi TaxID=30069 RepID=UPI0016587D39|nr:probable 26S proteasome regulatory subunit p27 [Anopheles stephensi]
MSVYELLSNQLESLINHFNGILEKNNVGMYEPLENDDGTPLAEVDVPMVQLARKLIASFRQDHKLTKKQIELEENHSMQEGDPHLVLSSVKPPVDETVELQFESLEEPISKYSFLKGDEIIQIVPLYPNNLELPEEIGNVLYDVVTNEVICVFHKQSTDEHMVFEILPDTDGYRLFHHVPNY